MIQLVIVYGKSQLLYIRLVFQQDFTFALSIGLHPNHIQVTGQVTQQLLLRLTLLYSYGANRKLELAIRKCLRMVVGKV